MTDKQIIIDDQKKTIHRLQDECTEKTNAIIALGEQLKRKEQECEELKNDNHTLLVTRQKLLNDLWIAEESLKDFKEICDKQCEQLEAYKMEAEEGKEINAELKAENDELKRQHQADKGLITSTGKMNYQLIQEYDKLKAENEELKSLLKVRIEDLCDSCGASSMMSMPCKVYEKTLTEIKEIAENAYCLTNGINKDMAQFAKQILQKISECEVG